MVSCHHVWNSLDITSVIKRIYINTFILRIFITKIIIVITSLVHEPLSVQRKHLIKIFLKNFEANVSEFLENVSKALHAL